MADEQRHITRIELTWANFLAGGDHGQSAILTDSTADLPYDEWVWKNDDASKTYVAAAQKYWDGAAWVYCDAGFADVTVTDDLLVDADILHEGDTDTGWTLTSDKILTQAGGVTMVEYTQVDAGQDVIEVNSAEVDIDVIMNQTVGEVFSLTSTGLVVNEDSGDFDFRVESNAATHAFFVDAGSEQVCVFKGRSGATANASYDDFVVEGASGVTGGMSVLASDGRIAAIALGDTTNPTQCTFTVDRANGRFQILGAGYGLTWQSNMLGVFETSPDRNLHVTVVDAATTTVSYAQRLTHTTSGTAAAGFGVGVEFELQSGGGNLAVGSAIESVLTDATDGAEDVALVFRTMEGGTLAETARLTNDGYWVLSNDGIDWSDNQNTAFGTVDGNYGHLWPGSTTDGGLIIQGETKAAAASATSVFLLGYGQNDPSDEGVVHVRGKKHDNAGGVEAFAADAHILTVENLNTDLFQLHGDGDLYLLGQARIGADIETSMLNVTNTAANEHVVHLVAAAGQNCNVSWVADSATWLQYNDESSANEMTFGVSASNDPCVYFGTDGQIYADLGGGAGNVTVFDDYDDPQELSRIIQTMDLDRGIELGVLTKRGDTYYVKFQSMMMLLAGACYQLDARLRAANL